MVSQFVNLTSIMSFSMDLYIMRYLCLNHLDLLVLLIPLIFVSFTRPFMASTNLMCVVSRVHLLNVYYKKYFIVYVDDLTITSNSFAFIAHFIVIISNQFSIKDLRFINYFLRLKLYQPTMVSFYPNTNIFGISYSDITWIVPKMLHFLCLPHPHYVSMILSTC